ncbi:chaperone modulator CbpM [Compostibacter hankyongensis]|uniref:MerR family transcriptional regulator n=1 Tax=Compostibacter hankyongensis TaxID=1007089 RepID=A0ABP8FJF0_9BACT
MQKDELIPLEVFCTRCSVEATFVRALEDSGLIEVVTVAESAFIRQTALPELEKLSRLHYDLDINLEGVEAISHLLQRVRYLQEEITALRNKLRMYEGED